MERWGIRDYDLLEFYQQASLVPHAKTFHPYRGQDVNIEGILDSLPMPWKMGLKSTSELEDAIGDEFIRKHVDEIRRRLPECLYSLEEVEKFERKNSNPTSETHVGRKETDGVQPKAGSPEETNGVRENHNFNEFARHLRFFKESDSEIKIQTPKKKPFPCPYHLMGFSSERTEGWKTLLQILKRRGEYEVGNTHDKKIYDAKRKQLQRVNEKILTFLKRQLNLDIPNQFFLFERAKDRPGVYLAKFQVGTSSSENDKTRTLDELELLARKLKEADEKSTQEKIMERFHDLATEALEKKWIDREDLEKLLKEPEEFRFDRLEKAPPNIKDQ